MTKLDNIWKVLQIVGFAVLIGMYAQRTNTAEAAISSLDRRMSATEKQTWETAQATARSIALLDKLESRLTNHEVSDSAINGLVPGLVADVRDIKARR